MARKVDTGISPKYGEKRWSVEQAIREIVQNNLDVRAELGCEGSITWDAVREVATVRDLGPGLEMRHLALGVSEKSGNAIGTFGEGLKMALLVLAREDRWVEIRTQGQIITARILPSETYETDTLHLIIDPMAPRHAATCTGTTVRFSCSQIELELGKAYFTQFAKVTWVEKDKVSEPGGFVFVNGSLVAEIDNAQFSYHLQGESAKRILNRDRDTVNTAALTMLVRDLIASTRSTKLIQALLAAMVDNQPTWENMQLVPLTNMEKGRYRVWRRVWNTMFPPNAVLPGDAKENRAAQYAGFLVLEGLNTWARPFLRDLGIPTAKEACRLTATKPKDAELTDAERATLTWAIATVSSSYTKLDPGKVKVITNMDALHQAGVGAETDGIYQRSTKMIVLNAAILSDRRRTLHTLLHEAVHMVSGAADLTSEFERALLDVAVGMILK